MIRRPFEETQGFGFAQEPPLEVREDAIDQLFERGVSELRAAFVKQDGVRNWQNTFPVHPSGLPRIVTRAQEDMCDHTLNALLIGETLDQYFPLPGPTELLWVNAMGEVAKAELTREATQTAS